LFLVFVDVAALVLRKTEYENSAVSSVGGDQRAKTATLPLSRPGNPFFQQPAAQISII
jgi:hypothetical protein